MRGAERHPRSRRNRQPPASGKEVESAKGLRRRGGAEGSAIRIGIAQAKRWGGVHAASADAVERPRPAPP
ncbi:hypothetical protein DWU95_47435 [Burkholderia contaminans]|nr:hypothetical protein DWU95_47435 [Burkholderia contaminans]